MKSLSAQIESLFKRALRGVLGDGADGIDPLIRPAGDDRHGDYQSNLAMSLAKQLGQKPRDVAQRIVDALRAEQGASDILESLDIAGPGFINIRLSPAWIAQCLSRIPAPATADRLGIEKAEAPETVVVDYSSPNIAKQMHVGHLRSTIIGDTIARVLAFEGHKVIRQNHIGDWGTQFGMLCAYLKEKYPAALDKPGEVHLADLEDFYRQASARDKEDQAFHERARAEVVALHQKEESTLGAWRYIVAESRNHYERVYDRLSVALTREDECGESFYADRLAGIVADLERRFKPDTSAGIPPTSGLPTITVGESDGALCLWHTGPDGEPLFKNPEGNPLPMIIRKSDGAFLYATTDLAAMDYRIHELHADRIIYVTGAPQAMHFAMVFAAVRAAGWTIRPDHPAEVRLEHVAFGSILGEDRKPFKTRSGGNVKLSELLDEAVSRSEQLIRANEADPEKKRGFTEEEIKDIAEAVGIGAVKYTDLSQNRQSDYVFSWDKMLSLEGNTAPYLMYAYARIRSIYRKGAEQAPQTATSIAITEPAERALARQILRLPETLEGVAAGLRLNLLTDYLYTLAGLFMKFYESCPVLGAATAEQKASRLALCDLTARTLRLGLGLLGIRVVERM